MRKKLILILTLFFLSYLFLAQTNDNEKILRIGAYRDFTIFAPWEPRSILRSRILWNIMEPLVILEENSTKVQPHLATSWKATNHNRIWTFRLRRGVKFHNGKILTADDVIASSDLFYGFIGKEFKAKAEKVDRFTVRFVLPEAHNYFANIMASHYCTITTKENVKKYKSLKEEGKFEEFVPIGSGPFKFLKHEKGVKITLGSFSDYWQGAPWLKNINYYIIPENNDRLVDLENGEIDLIDTFYSKDLPRMKANNNLRMINKFGMNVTYIAMNTDRKPLDNKKIRKALNLSVNKMRIMNIFHYGGYAIPTNRILSPAFWGFSALPVPSEYNPKKAKRMLAEAGYDKKLVLTIIIAPPPWYSYPGPKAFSKEIKRQFKEVGVKVKPVIPSSWDEYLNILKNTDYNMALMTWFESSGDPDYFLSTLLGKKSSEWNHANWQSTHFNAKLKAARELPIDNVAGRIRLYNEAQNIFQEEAPWIPIYHKKIFVIHNRRVKDIILYPSTMISYHKVKLIN